MADEHDTTTDDNGDVHHDTDDTDATDAAAGSADEEPTSANNTAPADGDDTDETADTEDELKAAVRDMPGLNRRIAGRLTLVYPQRTVVLRCDGDAALRILALVAGHPTGSLQDRLDPWASPAVTGWLVIDPDPLTAFWEPTFGSEPLATKRRLVVDPVPAALADSDVSAGLPAAS